MAYVDVVARRKLLLIQLQATAGCTEPAIREAVLATFMLATTAGRGPRPRRGPRPPLSVPAEISPIPRGC
jgi:hypothetical protein